MFNNRKKLNKLIILILTVILIAFVNTNVNAASYSFNFTGPSEATSGQTVTLTITGNGLTGKVNLSSSNATLSTSSIWIEKNSVNITAKINGFPAKITATPSELTDNEYNIVNISSKTITINQKQTSSGGGSTGGSGSTGGTNQGGSSGGGTSSGGTSNSGGTSSGSGTSGGGSSSGTNKPSSGGSSSNTKPQTGTSSSQSPDQTVIPNESNIDDGNIKSSNNYLSSISVSVGNLSPEFYRETFEYTVENLPNDITEIEVNATAEDERAHVSGLGVISLEPGENRIQIDVTAENENVREYVLIVNTKEELVESDLRLEELQISQIDKNGEFKPLDIGFDKETFEYTVDIDNDIVDLDVNPTVQKEGIIVETTGEKNLKDGENIVGVTLTAQNNQDIKTTYIIKVNRKSGLEASASVIKANEDWKIVVIGISLLILVIEIIAYIWMRKHFRTL